MNNKVLSSKNKFQKLLPLLITVGSIFYAGYAFGGDTAPVGVGQIASNVTGAFKYLGQLMVAISYLAGIGFTIASIFKFKQHKDNPTQIPMGTPIALLGVGIVLIFLPAIIKPVGQTLFGGEYKSELAGGYTGTGGGDMPGTTK